MVGSKENYKFDLGVKRLNNSTEKTGNNAGCHHIMQETFLSNTFFKLHVLCFKRVSLSVTII